MTVGLQDIVEHIETVVPLAHRTHTSAPGLLSSSTPDYEQSLCVTFRMFECVHHVLEHGMRTASWGD